MKHAPPNALIAKENELSDKLDRVNTRLREVDSVIRSTGTSRALYLREEANELLPDLSKATQEMLGRAFVGFITPSTTEKFEKNRKLFGIFKRKGAENALFSLQVDLARYLDVTQHGRVAEFDEKIKKCEAERKKLAEEKIKISTALYALRKVLESGKKPSAKLAQALIKPTVANPTPSTRQPTPSHTTNNYYQSTRDDNDFSNLLTLLLLEQQLNSNSRVEDPPFHGGGGTFDGAGASGDWSSDAPTTNNASTESNNSIIPAAGIAAVIATNDSLGSFS